MAQEFSQRQLGPYCGFPDYPVSGTAYQTNFADAHANIQVTLNPGALTTASVVLELSEDAGAHWVEVARTSTTGVTLAGLTESLSFWIPSGFSYRLTAVNASLGRMFAWG